jgi:HNH endonuclease
MWYDGLMNPDNETRTLPDDREVVITRLPDRGGWRYRAQFPGDTRIGIFGYGDAEDEAVTDLLVREFSDTMAALRRARILAGPGDDRDLPAGYRRYVHHLDGNPRNNDPANIVIVRGNDNARDDPDRLANLRWGDRTGPLPGK